MYSSDLYRELEAVTGRDPGWRGVGGLRLATTPERVEELQRQASAAATYGLELDLLGPDEAQAKLPLLAVDDVRRAAWLPGDGYLDPELLGLALAEGARAKGVEIHEHTHVTGLEVAGGRIAAVHTDRGTIRAETVVVAAGAATRAVAALAGVAVPIVPMLHQYVVSEPLEPAVGGDPHGARPRPHRLLPPGGRRAARRRLRARSAAARRGRPAGRPARAPPARHGALRRGLGGRAEPRARAAHGGDRQGRLRARGVHPRRRVHPGRDGGRRPLGGGGVLRARAGRRGRGREGHGGVDRRRAARVRRRRDGHPPLRRALPQPAPRPGPRPGRLRALLRRRLPARGARRRAPAARPAGLRAAGRARGELRREGRLGAGQLARGQRRGRRRGAAPARLGRALLVAGHRRGVPRRARHRRALRPVLLRQARGARRRRARGAGAAVRERGRPPGGHRGLHPAPQPARGHRGRPHRDPHRRGAVPARHRHGVRGPRPRLDPPPPAAGRVGRRRGRHRRPRLLLPVGPGRPRHPAAADGRRPLPRRLPLPPRPAASRSAPCRSSPSGSRSSASSGGSSTARPSSARAVGPRVGGGPRARHARRRATGRSTACGSRRATGCGARTSRRRRRPTPPGSASPCGRTSRAASSGATRWPPSARRAGRASACAASCSTTRSPCAWATSPCAPAATPCGRVTSGGYGHRVGESLAYAYLPASVDVGERVEIGVFGAWVGAEVAREPRYDPESARIKS